MRYSSLPARRAVSKSAFGKSGAVLLTVAAAAMLGRSASAATNTFQAGASWNTSGNWNLSHTPISTDELLFSTTFPATNTVDGNFTANSLSFNNGGTMAIDANVSGTTARTLTLNGNFTGNTTNANSSTDLISLLGGGTVNIGDTAGKGTLTLALGAATNNLNVANGGSLVFGASSIISGNATRALSFAGNSTGMLTLAGVNTFSGGFTLTSGIVRATTSTAALGAGVLSLGGGELQLANPSATNLNFGRNTTVTANSQITSEVTGSGNGNTYTLGTLSIGNNTLTVAGGGNVNGGTAGVTFGNTTVSGNSTFNVINPSVGGAAVLTLGNVTASAPRTITKAGNGTLTFSGTTVAVASGSQYILTGGTLNQSASNALGATGNAPGISILPTSGTGVYSMTGTITQQITTLTLGGANGTTATANTGNGTLTLSSGVTFDATNNPNAATISGKLSVATQAKTFNIGDSSAAADDLTLSGVLSNTAAGGSLIKTGLGTLVLSGANSSYYGGFSLNQGPLVAIGTGALGNSTSIVTFGGGSLELRNDGNTTLTAGLNAVASGATITVNRVNAAGNATTHTLGGLTIGSQTLAVVAGANITGNAAYGLTLGATTLSGSAVFGVANNGAGLGTLTLGVVSGGNNTFTKSGAGTVVFSAANSYSGDTNITGGTISIANSSALQNSTLNYTNANGGTFNFGSLTAATFGGLGGDKDLALVNLSSAAVTLTAGNNSASTLYSGILSGNGSLVKVGSGTLTLSAANIYSGTTTVGTATGNTSGTLATSGNGTIGAGAITIYDGTLAFGGASQTIGALSLGAGAAGATASVTIASGVTIQLAGFNSNGNGTNLNGSTISGLGTLTLGGATVSRQINVTDSGAATDLTISTVLADGSGFGTNATGFAKNSPGKMVLSGNNTFSGAAAVNAGVLNLQHNNALGAAGGTNSVTSGAALEMQNGITVSGESLTLAGTGVANGGALRNISGTNTWTGTVTLNSGAGNATRINSDAGSLILSGPSLDTSSTQILTLGGTGGNTTISSLISGNGSIVKDQAGTAMLSGNNTFTGNVSITGGALNIQHINALGTTAGVTSVSSGGALELQGGITFSGESLSLAGTGVSNGGALRSVSDGNSWAGVITLNGGAGNATRINSDTGTLTLSGATLSNAGPQILTLGGAGNTTISSVISGNGSFVKDGTGTVLLSGNNTYTGATTINSGTLKAGGGTVGAINGPLGNSSAVSFGNISGAALDLNGFDVQIGSLAGGGSIGGNIVLGNKTLTLAASNVTVYSGAISGSGGITRTATGGQQTFSGNNTYDGVTTISGGILLAASNTALGSTVGRTIVTSGGSSTLGLANNVTITGEQINIQGSGNNNLGALQAFTGATAEWAGNVVLDATARIGALDATAQLTVSGPISGLAGSALGISGLGTTILSAANNYAGPTTVFRGTLKLAGGDDRLPVGTALTLGGASGNPAVFDLNGRSQTVVSLDSSISQAGSGLVTNSSATPSVLTINNTSAASYGLTGGGNTATISGNLSLVKAGSFLQTFSAVNTYVGSTTINAGTLEATLAGAFSANSAFALGNVSTAVLKLTTGNQIIGSLTGGGTLGGNVTLGANALSIGNDNTSPASYAGVISGNGSISKIGSGTLTLSGANTYTGGTNVSNGTLALGANNVLANAGAVTVNNATLDFNTRTDTVAAVSLTGSGVLSGTNGSGSLSTTGVAVSGTGNSISGGTVGGDATFASGAGLAISGTLSGNANVGNGALSGSGTLTGTTSVNGGSITGTGGGLTLTGTTTFSGSGGTFNGPITSGSGVNVAGGASVIGVGALTGTASILGVLNLNGSVSGAVSVGNTGKLSGTNSVGSLTVAGGGILSPGNSPGTTTVSGDFTSAGILEVDLGGRNPSAGTGAQSNNRAGLDYDQVLLTGGGTVTLTGTTISLTGGAFTFDFAHTASGADPYVPGGNNTRFDNIFLIVGAGSISGIFTNTDTGRFAGTGVASIYLGPLGNLQEFALSYTGNAATGQTFGGTDVVLTAIPEPASLASLLAGLGTLIALRRRRN